MSRTLIGSDALDALRSGLVQSVNKYADPTDDGREGLDLDEALSIANEDVNLLWVEVEDLPAFELVLVSGRRDEVEVVPIGGDNFSPDQPGAMEVVDALPGESRENCLKRAKRIAAEREMVLDRGEWPGEWQ